jgi:paraquat-inducible protein B
LSKDAESLLKADTQFWIVRPRIGVGSVSGLDTLLSGVYIGMKTGAATLHVGESARSVARPARP